MDAVKVAEVFPPLMTRNLEMLQEDRPTSIKPATGTGFDIGAVARWYLHQANGVVIRQAVDMLGLPPTGSRSASATTGTPRQPAP